MSKNVDVLRARRTTKVTQQVKNKIWSDTFKTVGENIGETKNCRTMQGKVGKQVPQTYNVPQFLNLMKATGKCL